MTESTGAFITFVASVSPPIPHSTTAISHFSSAKRTYAAAARISNSVGFSVIFSHTGAIMPMISANFSFDISAQFMR